MSNEALRISLTKRALQRQMQDLGMTRSQALRALKGMPQDVRWKRLPLATRLRIIWECRGENAAA